METERQRKRAMLEEGDGIASETPETIEILTEWTKCTECQRDKGPKPGQTLLKGWDCIPLNFFGFFRIPHSRASDSSQSRRTPRW
jgi:hypothetical protein